MHQWEIKYKQKKIIKFKIIEDLCFQLSFYSLCLTNFILFYNIILVIPIIVKS